ncbi:MAG: hypothetical protein IT423_22280, partial [Pirellulaceae bacterium]|nr:hypothetical protein [Pirellulaceae bacterium]
MERRFRKQIYPLLTHDEKGCVECHNTAGTSNLVLSGDARSDFRLLLDEQYFKLVGADTLLNRLSTAHVERRMPKEAPTWNASEIQKLTRFLKSVKQLEESTGVAADERFPRALLDKYTGPKNTSTDNQFITYHQLRGKVKVQFADDWVRDGRDGFAENLAMFGGADFKSRFNESSQPSAAFLTALETMAREVSARAFDEQIGPFQDWPKPSARPEPVGAFVDESLRDSSVSESESGSSRGEMRLQPDYRSAIDHLYQRILFRPASQAELVEAYSLIRDVYGL